MKNKHSLPSNYIKPEHPFVYYSKGKVTQRQIDHLKIKAQMEGKI